MGLRPLVSNQNVPYNSPTFTCYLKPNIQSQEMPRKVIQSKISRRIAAVASIVLAKEAMLSQHVASGLEFKLATPDERTVEEAESGVSSYAQSLTRLKALLESESWKEARKVLRRSSSNLKLDLYAVIQSKPAKERPQLRTLYSNLFNNVTKVSSAYSTTISSNATNSSTMRQGKTMFLLCGNATQTLLRLMMICCLEYDDQMVTAPLPFRVMNRRTSHKANCSGLLDADCQFAPANGLRILL